MFWSSFKVIEFPSLINEAECGVIGKFEVWAMSVSDQGEEPASFIALYLNL